MSNTEELPPLPMGAIYHPGSATGCAHYSYTADQMRAYARQAQAQPAASGEPVAWAVEAFMGREWSMQWPPRMGRDAAEADLLQYRPGSVLRIRPLVFGDNAQPAPAPAPGYCKHCKQYTIDEPLPAEPAPALVPLTSDQVWQAVGTALDDSMVKLRDVLPLARAIERAHNIGTPAKEAPHAAPDAQKGAP